MNANELLMWLRGIADTLGDEPPSFERWDRIREQLRAAHMVPTGSVVAQPMRTGPWPTLIDAVGDTTGTAIVPAVATGGPISDTLLRNALADPSAPVPGATHAA